MKHPPRPTEQLQPEQLLALGRTLQQTRQAQAKSLDTISELTLIRKSLLVAMEAGDRAQLPEPIYVRALLRRYGEALGLDGETLAGQYFPQPKRLPVKRSWTLPAAQLRPVHLYGAYVLLILAAVSGLSYFLRSAAPETAALPILDPEAVEQLMPKTQTSPPSQPPAQPLKAEDPPSPIRVELKLTDQSWVRIVSDGDIEFQGILQPGESRSWAANQSLTVRAGNAGGVMLSDGTAQPQPMGEPGTVAERTFGQVNEVSMTP
ncbi:helix-turn-helix domain-containing protein [Romeria aff. gracilis LEGE 07310]|uniref:Helix-turn-helix domain-containing protein n=1 Tax=Vasconcelosia minhoensis LEGE 07310 TaxID=915328 RepID=A0A8J7AQH1_9CYAN|nr:RodZ domain-containing protein [Romeria gracilis]MBE9078556.1 helix-turn-helix domain-containing protein [Romeria aff. gracilis LEGE 07310]